MQSIREGLLLAREQANQSESNAVDLIIRGRVGQWGADAGEAARMVTDDGAQGLIAPPDGAASHLVLQVSGRTAIPVISLCSDSSVGRTGVPWLLRNAPGTEEQAKMIFGGLRDLRPSNRLRWAALVPDGRTGREISHDLKRAATASNYELENVLEVSLSLTNLDAVAQKIDKSVNALLLWLAPEPAGKAVRNLRAKGYAGILAGPFVLDSAQFTAAAGDTMEGLIIPGIVSGSAGATRWNSFRDDYLKRWRHEPDLMAGLTYDSALLLNRLLRLPDFDVPPHKLPDQFSWPGVTGTVRFDAEGNRIFELELKEGHGGTFVPIPKR